jgi:hypothetical protein
MQSLQTLLCCSIANIKNSKGDCGNILARITIEEFTSLSPEDVLRHTERHIGKTNTFSSSLELSAGGGLSLNVIHAILI